MKVKYARGTTINLGNYESARVDVGLEAPATADSLEDMFELIHAWVEEKLEQEAERIRAEGDE